MKCLVFLDMDGVLNSHQYFETGAHRRPGCSPDESMAYDERLRLMIDPTAVVHLNAIVRAAEAQVVISSSWRLVYSVPDIRRALRARGFEFAERILGKTGYRHDGDSSNRRGLEIQDYLVAVYGNDPPGFVILDDSADMGTLLSKLVRTTYPQGLQAEHVPLALEILGVV